MNRLLNTLKAFAEKIDMEKLDVSKRNNYIKELREEIEKHSSKSSPIITKKYQQLKEYHWQLSRVSKQSTFSFEEVAAIQTDLVPENISWIDVVYDFLKENDLYNANCTVQYIKKEKTKLKKNIVESYAEYFRKLSISDCIFSSLYEAINDFGKKIDNEIHQLNKFSLFIYKVNKFLKLDLEDDKAINRQALKSVFMKALSNSDRRIDGQNYIAVNFNSIDDYLAYIISCSYFFDPTLVRERHAEILKKYINKELLPARRSYIKDNPHYYSEIPNREDVEVERDKDGNFAVRQMITNKTGIVVSQGKTANNFVNYVISHVWDNATDERYLTNFWNIALIPAWANAGMDKADEQDFISMKLKRLIQKICFELYGMDESYYQWKKLGLDGKKFIDSNSSNLNGKYTINIIHEKSISDSIDIDSLNLDFRYIIRKGNLTNIIPDKDMISKLIIPDTVISIGNDLCDKDKLSDKNPPSIYDNKDCYVQALEIPSSVKTIKSWAFYYFTHLEKITFHEGLKAIEANAFRRTIGYDAGNYELHFPKSLESIGNYAFDQCGISKVYLNSTVSCGTGAFSDNTILHFYDDDTEVVFKDYKGL